MRFAVIAVIVAGGAWAEERPREDCPRPRKERAVELIELFHVRGALPRDKVTRFHLENAEEKLCGPRADINAALGALGPGSNLALALACRRPLVLRFGKSVDDLRRALRKAKAATERADEILAPVVQCLSPVEPLREMCIVNDCFPVGPRTER